MEPYHRCSSNNSNHNHQHSIHHHASTMNNMVDHKSKRTFYNSNNSGNSNSWIFFSLLLRSRVYIHWRAGFVLLIAICIAAIIILTSPTHSPIAIRDYDSVFASITNRRVASKWRGYLNRKTLASPNHPKLYYPRQCPTNNRSCAKLVPSFIFAGSELSGTTYIFSTLQTHPQVIGTVDHQNSGTLFDSDDEALFEAYLSQFPTLQEEIPLDEIVVAGEHAPQYLYRSHIAARRLRELLPHVKLVFILRDPIDRAYSQYFTGADFETASFETLMETELDILRQCGHTTTGWEGFVRCHESNEIRVARDSSFNSDATNCTEECDITTSSADEKAGLDSLARGMYYTALLPFLDEFPASQIFVKRTEDFLTNPSASFQLLARFLGIDPTYFSERNFYKHYGLTESMLFGKDTVPPPPPYYQANNNGLRHHHLPSQQQQQQHEKISALALEDGFGEASKDGVEDSFDYDDLPNFVKSPSDIPILDLGTRYRMQKVFRHMNQRLLDLFERGREDFPGWDYDVERG
ncbi:P-loop containing nucleoside triphosphate hydrolase protein [Zychaea mexicana]|uniref:P-loop containing nucleoside triphosphate hydrolase protein n=1 Tax=Zychaea mexicana TaxID=64656 RepID=UPI0022FDF764|nr:P-loop containing nucleoside triphosphate hydrolase protein [Zychaea mexicana]KAI9490789.1 P-loop containing nucleoside triphosphate hydrolase protein [Zychaea mexicana]